MIDKVDIGIFALNSFLILGLLVSYYPQILRIHTSKSSIGISPQFLLLGFLGSICNLSNITILSIETLERCSQISLLLCIQRTFGVSLIAVQTVLFSSVTGLSLYHSKSTKTAISLFIFTTLSSLIVSTVILINNPSVSLIYASMFGVVALGAGCLQYIPQVWTTWKKRDFGALSIATLLMQCPGSFLFVYSIYTSTGTNWSSWISFALSGFFQLILIILYYYFRSQYTAIPGDIDEVITQ